MSGSYGMITRSRAFSREALKVVNNVAKQQFTISMRGADDAVIGYETRGKEITLNHTNVPQEFQGKGVGKLLAKYAFDHASKNNLNVTCKCHFLAKYYKQNCDKYKGLQVTVRLDEEQS